jgi:hypothetical protein
MKKLFYCLLCLLLVGLYGCGSKEAALNEAFGKMTNVSQIGTVEYGISKLIIADSRAFYKIGDRKIIFSCKATMKAGIDLDGFSAENVAIDDKSNTIKVKLPQPTILAFNMPAEQIKLEYSKVSGLRSSFSVEDRNELLKQGEAAIMADAANLGIFDDARKNATLFFEAMFKRVGFDNVEVTFNDEEENE